MLGCAMKEKRVLCIGASVMAGNVAGGGTPWISQLQSYFDDQRPEHVDFINVAFKRLAAN